MTFVDTGAWFAMAEPSDQDHVAVAQCFSQSVARLITTDYVIEILSSCLSRLDKLQP